MIKEAMEKVEQLAAPNLSSFYGVQYTDKALEVVRRPEVDCLQFNTLAGAVRYLKAEEQKFFAPVVFHVDDYNKVTVLGGVDEWTRRRECIANIVADTPRIEFDSFLPVDKMIIALRSKFIPTEDSEELLRVIGNITDEHKQSTLDDGVSQSVVARVGLARVADTPLKPIVTLQPFRTFSEVRQPASDFLLRMRQGAEVALFEADGGTWKLEAKTFIKEQLEELVEDAAFETPTVVVL